MQKTWVGSLGWEVPLEMEMAMLSSFLAWRIPMDSGAGGPQFMGSQRVRHNWATKHNDSLCITLGNLHTYTWSLAIFPSLPLHKWRKAQRTSGIYTCSRRLCLIRLKFETMWIWLGSPPRHQSLMFYEPLSVCQWLYVSSFFSLPTEGKKNIKTRFDVAVLNMSVLNTLNNNVDYVLFYSTCMLLTLWAFSFLRKTLWH